MLQDERFCGTVLDIGGKSVNRRGRFSPPLHTVDSWNYLNSDLSVQPDFHCSAEKIPASQESFDAIVMTEVLEHIEEPAIVLCEAFRVLKKAGKIVSSIPFLFHIHPDPEDFQRWTPAKIQREFGSAGFHSISIRPMGGLFSVVHDLFFCATGYSLNGPTSLSQLLLLFVRRSLFSIFTPVCLFLDSAFPSASEKITTGYYVVAEK